MCGLSREGKFSGNVCGPMVRQHNMINEQTAIMNKYHVLHTMNYIFKAENLQTHNNMV